MRLAQDPPQHREASMPGVHDPHKEPTKVLVYWNIGQSEEVYNIEFSSPGFGLSASVWTTQEGLESLRDAINATLARADAARQNRAA